MRIIFILLTIAFFVNTGFCQNQKKIDSLENVLGNTKNDTIKVHIYNRLFLEYEFNDISKAKDYLEHAIALSQSINNQISLAESYKNMGFLHEDKSEYLSAIDYYNKALTLYLNLVKSSKVSKKSDLYKNYVASCYNYLGNAWYYQSNFIEANKHYQKALKIWEEIDDKSGTAKMYICLGNIQLDQKNLSKAMEYYQYALKINKEINNKSEITGCLINIGQIYHEQKNYDNEKENLQIALDYYTELGNLKGIALCLNNIGLIYLEKKEFEKALKNYQSSLEISNRLGDNFTIAMILGNISDIYIKQKKYLQAIEYAKKSLKIAKEIGAIEHEKSAYFHLSIANDSLGNNKEAIIFLNKYMITKDSLFNTERHKQIAQMEAIYQNEKKQKEIELLNKDKALQDIEVRSQKLQKFAFIAGFIFMLVIAYFILRGYRKKKKSNILLTYKNIEIQTQKEEIITQKEEIENQRDTVLVINNELNCKNKQITDSINYAKLIQIIKTL